MKCVKAGRYLDRHRGWVELTPGPGPITYVTEDSAAYRERPECFAPANAEHQVVRSGEVMRFYCGPDAAVVGKVRVSTPKRSAKPRPPRPSAPPRPPHAPAGVAAPPPIAPAPPRRSTEPPRAIRRHQADEISTELRRGARDALWGFATRAGNGEVETGGLLLGRREGLRFVILEATESGPNCVRERNGFTFDSAHDLSEAKRLYESEGLELCGVWHSHVQHGYSALSDLDLRSAAAWQEELGTEVLFALVSREAGSWKFWPHVCSQSSYRAGPAVIRPSALVV